MARLTYREAKERKVTRQVLEELITARQAAKIKGCSEKAIYEAIQSKRLHAERVGPVWLVNRRNVEEWQMIGHRPAKPKKSPLADSMEIVTDGED